MRVIDTTQILAGPKCGRIPAEFGGRGHQNQNRSSERSSLATSAHRAQVVMF